MSGIAVGLTKGHVVTKRDAVAKPSRRKGALSIRIKKGSGVNKRLFHERNKRVSLTAKEVRAVIRQCTGFAPYERRVMELLKVGKDKRALKMCKRKLGTHLRGKKKRDEMAGVLRKIQSAAKVEEKAEAA